MFEVEDPEGPLEMRGEDIGQRFGRLQVKSAAELRMPPGQLSELTAAQGNTPQPNLKQDLELWKHHVGIHPHPGRFSISVHVFIEILLQACKMMNAGRRVLIRGSRVGLHMTEPQSQRVRLLREMCFCRTGCLAGENAATVAEVQERIAPGETKG